MGSAIFFYLARLSLSKTLGKCGAISEKNPNKEVDDVEFPGLLNK